MEGRCANPACSPLGTPHAGLEGSWLFLGLLVGGGAQPFQIPLPACLVQERSADIQGRWPSCTELRPGTAADHFVPNSVPGCLLTDLVWLEGCCRGPCPAPVSCLHRNAEPPTQSLSASLFPRDPPGSCDPRHSQVGASSEGTLDPGLPVGSKSCSGCLFPSESCPIPSSPLCCHLPGLGWVRSQRAPRWTLMGEKLEPPVQT